MNRFPKVICWVGHRGTGKTSLLARLKKKRPDWEFYDLDRCIEQSTGTSIEALFKTRGEAHFRKLEIAELRRLVAQSSAKTKVIALGAGFEGKIPAHAACVWIRRQTDVRGRIFLDRPRLDNQTSPLSEYLSRFPTREHRFESMADETLTLREGEETRDQELLFFTEGYVQLGGVLTLLPENFRRNIQAFLKPRLEWGTSLFEIRDDLLSPKEIRQALKALPADRVLFSFRKALGRHYEHPPENMMWDWDLDLGPVPSKLAPIVSLHASKKNETLTSFLRRLETGAPRYAILKAAPIIRSFAELLEGHRWWQQDPEHRAFLPRSPEAGCVKWLWYRLLQKGKMPLTFWREAAGSAQDQPYLLQWADAPIKSSHFAAVLGDPVAHSRTPTEQRDFFFERGMPCLAIPVSEADWRAGAMDILTEMGLTHAAVTSPLKTLAYEHVRAEGGTNIHAESLCSVNTIVWDSFKRRWRGTSTDLQGFATALREIPTWKECAVWGGGGVLPIVKECLPRASYYSAREGKLKSGPGAQNPDLVVWAAGRVTQMPPRDWKPRFVLDLNYFEDSPGRAYALSVGAKYVSGLSMFEAQAIEQRKFWGTAK